MKKPRILLADDHRMVAEGLRGLLELDYDLVGIVEDGRALLEAADRLMPDVVVADVSMPLLNGIEAVRQLKKKNPDVAVVFLTMHMDVAYAASAFEAGPRATCSSTRPRRSCSPPSAAPSRGGPTSPRCLQANCSPTSATGRPGRIGRGTRWRG